MRFCIEVVKKYLPAILMLAFVLLKIQDLFFPYYWDEAWSYIPAIKAMATQGPSLLPNSISPDLYRGHPLFFYFASSLWIKIFGAKLAVAKIFPLIISLGLLQATFSFAKKNFNYLTAILSLGILMIQSVYFVQATLFLPEILLALFTVLSLGSFLDKKYTLTLLWLSLALNTKESGIVIWGIITFIRFIEVLQLKNVSILYRIKSCALFLLPLLLNGIFFLIQKLWVGWYFFPEHISYLNVGELFNKLNAYASYLFIFMGRNLLTFLGLLALIWLIIKKDVYLNKKRKVLLILTLFILSYLLFSSLNFYSPRYILSILPFVIMLWVYFIERALHKYHYVLPIIIFSTALINNLNFTLNKRGCDDHSLGYRDLVGVQTKIVNYCEEKDLYSEGIYTHFLMRSNLTNKDLGYLKNDRIFSKVSADVAPSTTYALFSSNELDEQLYESVKSKNVLLKRFEQNGSWTELYKMKKH